MHWTIMRCGCGYDICADKTHQGWGKLRERKRPFSEEGHHQRHRAWILWSAQLWRSPSACWEPDPYVWLRRPQSGTAQTEWSWNTKDLPAHAFPIHVMPCCRIVGNILTRTSNKNQGAKDLKVKGQYSNVSAFCLPRALCPRSNLQSSLQAYEPAHPPAPWIGSCCWNVAGRTCSLAPVHSDLKWALSHF